ncbi:MAG: ExbD/TolR family protein [Mucilaginibacter sp.]
MAELTQSPEKTGGKHLVKRAPLRVDLTAMVDLAFLLITFFMLTTSLVKPREMNVVMPADGPKGPVSDKTTMTICLGSKNQAIYYLGMAEKPLTTPALTGYGAGIRRAILNMSNYVFATAGKSMMVLIKPAEHSVYENLVDALDEMNIAKVPSYALSPISPKEIDLLKSKGIY